MSRMPQLKDLELKFGSLTDGLQWSIRLLYKGRDKELKQMTNYSSEALVDDLFLASDRYEAMEALRAEEGAAEALRREHQEALWQQWQRQNRRGQPTIINGLSID